MSPMFTLLVLTIVFVVYYCQANEETVTSTISGVPYKLSTQTPNPLRRIEFVSVTVDNMDLSSQFYGDVLGGKKMTIT